MIQLKTLYLAFAVVACLSSATVTQAGEGCGCSHGPAHNSPMMYSDPGVDAGGGGLVQLGNVYGSAGVYGPVQDDGYHIGGQYTGGHYTGGHYGRVSPRSFQSGFESLPNMDGGGVHHRLPFHSYRRPWAHPGIATNNINIVW